MNFRNRKKGNVEVHTSALNDIMFFLMLFFLLASAVANPQVVKLLLPESSSGQQSNAQKTVTVSIDDKLNYYVEDKIVPKEGLKTALESYQRNAPDLTIILYVANKGVTFQDGLEVFDIANQLKLKVVVAVEPKK
ncbi:ExbD/TolR family protein [Pedobacter flavus]|uniref:Biopolymer transporter ExbD n=1 Tax=Pedobacter flavus TaxID=3113906 RepID=A0ABU7H3U1_9SPHI|nr:biopolymer transporter ExbD [Pedobacter sp. VNH31]MEE1885995.1 biopolymer transporter ExbD [Pedobacter sp. VNH31]